MSIVRALHGLCIMLGLIVLGFGVSVFALVPTRGIPEGGELPADGKTLYSMSCAVCHGADGRGAPPQRVGFDTPLPDFSDCRFAPREANQDWIMVAEEGGPARGFDPMMPAFSKALTKQQLRNILDHIRTFCTNPAWPRGELNLPRPQVTTKAFPEDEVVIEFGYNAESLDAASATFIYEKRFGPLNQFEIAVPYYWQERVSGAGGDTSWESGVGDVALGLKRVFYHSLERGTIVSLGGEVLLPTGDEAEGFGSDTVIFEPYLAYGQMLPHGFFAHVQGGFALPEDKDYTENEAFWRMAIGRTFTTGRYGRAWSPIVELVGAEELVAEAQDNWDFIPQLQVTLNTRQHVRLNAGVRIPINDSDTREPEFLVYLFWDWFDGGLLQGW